MSSPTYGTDKTSGEQLADDVSGMFSIAPKQKDSIDYKPRPDLVKPAKGEAETLPPPQDNVASADNPQWPESPEQKRARLRAQAAEDRDKPGFKPQIENDMQVASAGSASRPSVNDRQFESGVAPGGSPSIDQQRVEFNKRLAETRQGSDQRRKYLSEPPLAYREPAPTAAANDVGEDEDKKARQRKAAARKKGDGWSLKNLWPW